MNYSKRYFSYLIKKNYKVVLALFVLGFLIFPLPAILSESINYEAGETIHNSSDMLLYMGTVIVCFSCYILPIVLRGVFLDRKKCDLYLSLPMKKEKIYLLNSIFGYLSFLTCFTLLLFIVFVANTFKGKPFNAYYLCYYLGMIVISLSIFSLSSLISSLANNLLDAVLMNVTLIVAGYVGYLLFCTKMGVFYYTVLPISFADSFTAFCQRKIVGWGINDIENLLFNYSIVFPIHLLIGVGCFCLSYLETKVFKSENAGDKTRKIYSYPIINGLLFLILFSLIFSNFSVISSLVLISSYFISEFVYKRKIKFDKGMLIRLVIYLAISALLRLNQLNQWIILT